MSMRPGIHVGVCFSSGTPGSPVACIKCSTPNTIMASVTNTRPTVISALLPGPRHPSIAFPARSQPAPPNDISRKTIVQMNLSCGRRSAPGRWIIATNRNIMIPKSRPDQRIPILVAMLKDAAINAQPTEYTQNIRQGIYGGTIAMTNCGPKRCSAPKTASGMAKHKLLKATSLSRPRASAISFFAANTPITKSAIPAKHIATSVREISKNMAKIVWRIDFPICPICPICPILWIASDGLFSLSPKRDHWIDLRRPTRRNPAGEQGYAGQQQRDADISRQVGRANAEEQGRHQPAQRKSSEQANHRPGHDRLQALSDDQPQNVSGARAKGHSQAEGAEHGQRQRHRPE